MIVLGLTVRKVEKMRDGFKKFLFFLFFLLISGCGNESSSSLKEAMDWLNNPTNIPGASGTLMTVLNSLPERGNSNFPVWNGYWYPSSQNGTARRPPNAWSPMEKYDQAMGDSGYQATNWEKESSKQLSDTDWAGHCNGLAAASTMVTEPKRAVVYKNVTFTVDDIKALLIEAWGSGGKMVGGRCNAKTIHYDTNGRIVESECRDLNPGTFHILVTNFLGNFHTPIIADTDNGDPVWNYPIVSYEVKYKQLDLNAQAVNMWLFNVNKNTYDYNPNAKSFAYYQTQIALSTGVQKIYEYILELDGAGNILGGEWFRNSKKDHPDFLWRHTQPTTENPYIDLNVVYAIYNQSKDGTTPSTPGTGQVPGQNP